MAGILNASSTSTNSVQVQMRWRAPQHSALSGISETSIMRRALLMFRNIPLADLISANFHSRRFRLDNKMLDVLRPVPACGPRKHKIDISSLVPTTFTGSLITMAVSVSRFRHVCLQFRSCPAPRTSERRARASDHDPAGAGSPSAAVAPCECCGLILNHAT
jgi:hypothetical protein